MISSAGTIAFVLKSYADSWTVEDEEFKRNVSSIPTVYFENDKLNHYAFSFDDHVRFMFTNRGLSLIVKDVV